MKSDNRMVILVVLLGVAIIAVSFTVINMNGKANNTEYPLPVIDAFGRQVTFEEVPDRIISAAPGTTEMLYALGLGDKVVGVTDYCNWPSEVVTEVENGNLTSIGGYWEPSIETIIYLDPDLVVLCGGVAAHGVIADQLDSIGIKAFVTWKGENITEIYQNIEVLGEICDCHGESSSLIQSMKDRVDYLEGVVSGYAPRKVLHAVWLDPVYTCGGDTFASQVISLAGGENIFADLLGWPTVSIEAIIIEAPEVITITATMMMSTPEEIVQALEEDEQWSQIPAVQSGEVYILFDQGENIFNRQSVRIVDALEIMAKILYPEAFGVTMPLVIGNDYEDYLISETSGAASMVTMQGQVAYV